MLSWSSGASHAEMPAPSVHWGALAYPDQERTLETGVVFNRFTEFNSSGARYNSTIHDTIGLNLATLTWTERRRDWTTNVTIGAGPTTDQPRRFFQNDFIHNFFLHEPHVPSARREKGPTSQRPLP